MRPTLWFYAVRHPGQDLVLLLHFIRINWWQVRNVGDKISMPVISLRCWCPTHERLRISPTKLTNCHQRLKPVTNTFRPENRPTSLWSWISISFDIRPMFQTWIGIAHSYDFCTAVVFFQSCVKSCSFWCQIQNSRLKMWSFRLKWQKKRNCLRMLIHCIRPTDEIVNVRGFHILVSCIEVTDTWFENCKNGGIYLKGLSQIQVSQVVPNPPFDQIHQIWIWCWISRWCKKESSSN